MGRKRATARATTSPWSGLEVRHLAAFVTVAEHRSFARAARALGYTSPAISQQLTQLESIVGHRLLARTSGSRTVDLTEAGRIFLEHAHRSLAQFDAARLDLMEVTGETDDLVRITVAPTIAHRLLPALSMHLSREARARGEEPDLGLFVRELGTPDDVAAALEDGSLDVALTPAPLPPGSFASRTVMTDPWALVVPARHEFATSERIGVERLDELRRVSTLKYVSPEFESFLDAYLTPGKVRVRTSNHPQIVGMVEAGMTAALLPRLLLDSLPPAVAVVEVDPAPPAREISLVWHRDRVLSAATREFIEAAAEACRAFSKTRARKVA